MMTTFEQLILLCANKNDNKGMRCQPKICLFRSLCKIHITLQTKTYEFSCQLFNYQNVDYHKLTDALQYHCCVALEYKEQQFHLLYHGRHSCTHNNHMTCITARHAKAQCLLALISLDNWVTVSIHCLLVSLSCS